MKHGYQLLVCLLLLAGQRSVASNFCPLRPGVLQQYTQASGDTTYGVQLRKLGGHDGQDSLYALTRRVSRLRYGVSTGCGWWGQYRLGHALFGQRLRVINPGTFQVEYVFEEFDPVQGTVNSFYLRPYAALRQPWQADDYHMAQVTARGTALVLGQPDSVVTISLSGGRTLRLSKTYGLVEGPAPFDCATGRLNPRFLTLTALPSRGLGTALLGVQGIYNFQPGDVFCYEYVNRDRNSMGPVVIRHTYGDSVLSRSASRSGDTISYRIWRYFPGAGGPSYTYTLQITPTSHPLLSGATGRFVLHASRQHGMWINDVVRSPVWPAGRGLLRLNDRMQPCRVAGTRDTLLASAPADGNRYLIYGAGLGQTSLQEENTTCCSVSTTLLGYRKGSEQWGTVFRLGRPLAARAGRAAATVTAAPNPFGQELSLHLPLRQRQAITLRLLNSLGQVVLEKTTAALPGGAQLLAVPTAGLPAGLYTAQVQFGADGRTEMLKVIKQ